MTAAGVARARDSVACRRREEWGQDRRRRDEKISPVRMTGPEGRQGPRLEGGRIPLALDRVDSVAIADDHEVDFVPLFVPPIPRWMIGKRGREMFEHEMLPEHPEVVGPQGIPPAGEAHESGVESVCLRLSDDFRLAAAVERPHECDRIRDLERPQMALHGGPGDADRPGGLGGFEESATLPQEVFKHGRESIHVAKSKEPLDVAREERVEPFPVEARPLAGGEQRRSWWISSKTSTGFEHCDRKSSGSRTISSTTGRSRAGSTLTSRAWWTATS